MRSVCFARDRLKVLDHRRPRRGGHENVEIADGLAHAAVAAGDRYLLYPVQPLQPGDQGVGVLRRRRELEAAHLGQVMLHRAQDVLLALLAEAGKPPDASVARGTVDLFQGFHVEIVIEHLDALRAEAGEMQQLRDRGRQLPMQAFQQRATAARDDFAYFRRQVVADARQGREILALVHQAADVATQFADDARGVAVGADAERIGALNFEQVGDLPENPGDVGIVGRHVA